MAQEPEHNEPDIFEIAGIDLANLKGKWIKMNVGKSKVEGQVLLVNTQYGLLKVKTNDGYTHFIRVSKVSDLAVKDREKDHDNAK